LSRACVALSNTFLSVWERKTDSRACPPEQSINCKRKILVEEPLPAANPLAAAPKGQVKPRLLFFFIYFQCNASILILLFYGASLWSLGRALPYLLCAIHQLYIASSARQVQTYFSSELCLFLFLFAAHTNDPLASVKRLRKFQANAAKAHFFFLHR